MSNFEEEEEEDAGGAVDEAIAQVPEVVELAQIHGRDQPKMREMAAEFFLGVSGSEQGRRSYMHV